MYSKVLPGLKALDSNVESPDAFYVNEDEGVMVMENLKTKGYGIPDKDKGTS